MKQIKTTHKLALSYIDTSFMNLSESYHHLNKEMRKNNQVYELYKKAVNSILELSTLIEQNQKEKYE